MSLLLRLVPNYDYYDRIFRRLGPSGYTVAINITNTTPELYHTTLPDDWVSEYTEKKYAFLDPVLQFTMFSSGSKRWDEIMALKIPLLSKIVYDRACHFNLNFGGAVVKKNFEEGRKKNLFSFARSERQPTDEEMLEAVDVFDQLLGEIRPEDKLTARQLRILTLSARGMTRAQVAKDIGRSDETVRDEIRLIRAKLGNAENITEAVAIALDRNLIFLQGKAKW